jgi:hypothetical protein
MACTHLEVIAFLTGKLKMSKEERRHVHFHLDGLGKRLGLPAVLALSRGKGDVARKNVKGLADGLGLTYHGFESGVQCNISMECVYLCFVARFLLRVADCHNRDKVTFNVQYAIERGSEARAVIAEIAQRARQWRPVEVKELGQCRGKLLDVVAVAPRLSDVCKLWLEVTGLNAS